MSDFSKSRFSRPSFNKKQMFKAECAECGNTCEVPFRPNGKKPVFCNDCFAHEDSARDSRREFSPRPSYNNDRPAPRPDQAFNDLKAELRGVNEKLERLISLLSAKK